MASEIFKLDEKALLRAQKILNTLANKDRNKALWAGTGAAASVVAKKARQDWRTVDDPDTPEQIAKKIAIRRSARTTRITGNPTYRVGVRGGANSRKSDHAHWRFLEFGTEHHPAYRIWGAILETVGSQAFKAFETKLTAELDKITKKR